jgi:hypothetical protein
MIWWGSFHERFGFPIGNSGNPEPQIARTLRMRNAETQDQGVDEIATCGKDMEAREERRSKKIQRNAGEW